ncbi:MAG TPA: type I-C CRISPR-associated protein Cas5 [Lachnospiraceae bacterium]|jgi:CRISPR-associated protein Cas5d|nr:type I-C CRISPR-associated protein Cas5 [Lachnospiraceae bacterium]HBI72926.1 type I-C CRISPR-associated protein Cas5 [Lachnospiraceae bacterium]HBY72889.1 type I-C CRISPR-associated protein Cas5 [Lachnospiraceae bacterium]HCA70244.1 type I-C CRISPR-associated protein Cas5 [Lachnospiraceae bacterium]HCM11663.1 type I-C CRISPR-associated protein Cas5 [Lachnospiraceae bacterium]
MENAITYRVYGRYALFTDPLTRVGGEKSSLFVPTYQALIGITESIYWKPTIRWKIDKVRVINPICTESKGTRPIRYGGGNDLSYTTYLRDVVYIVKAHFEQNPNRPDLAHDYNENKHYFIAKRCLEKGGRRDVFLGTRECSAYVEQCEFNKEKGFYDSRGDMEFGLQFHSFSYPDYNGKDMLYAQFWRPKMVNGVIEFCKPEECTVIKEVHKQGMKKFIEGRNFSGLNEPGLLDGYKEVQV